ncbi:MAG: DUF2269 domain-containing protein [Euzebyales bacterium]|nr:DUF2269 domain-containing protein [Euzebyales bacterium]
MSTPTITREPAPVAAAPERVAANRPRRLSPRARKLALTAHIVTSVGWLGIVVAMLVLGVTAATAADPAVIRAGFTLMDLFGSRIFPPAALASLATGIILSLGTKWGLLRYRWVVVKLVLTFAVIATGTQLTGRLLDQATTASAAGVRSVPGGVAAALIAGSVMHLLLLGAATAISVYKPWGRTRRGSPL